MTRLDEDEDPVQTLGEVASRASFALEKRLGRLGSPIWERGPTRHYAWWQFSVPHRPVTLPAEEGK